MNINDNYSSDQPISLKKDDKFQRYEFSKRIANTIIERKEEDCIVLGVYGAWGEGKTSVINFIEQELKLNQQVIVMKFNPWRYGDENLLLRQFFFQFASALDKKLITKTENAGEVIKKYSRFLNFDIPVIGGNIGEAAQGVGDTMADVDLETLKERIEKIIKDAEKKIVVFVDDIDRLDKSEIYSMFRLVKLNADFKNTTYILSFDEKIVSSAIGDRFGSGNQDAGRLYLEKIVQIPLNIPTAQSEDLKSFCFKLLDTSLSSNKIEIPNDDAGRFASLFTQHVLGRLKTPRLAVRYSNSISFSLPLLLGEVNLVDLMLIEAIKIFYPAYYDFIKENPEFFIGNYKKKYSDVKDDEKIKELKEHLTILNKDLTSRQQEDIKEFLFALFPLFKLPFRNINYSDNSYKEWIKGKRIASPNYFNRYFSYSVIRGELSDVAFQNFVNEIPNQSVEDVGKAIEQLVSESSPGNFLFKIRMLEEEFPQEVAEKLARAVCMISQIFPHPKNGFFFSFTTPQSQAGIFVKFLLKKIKDKTARLKLAKELLAESKHIDFADEVRSWLVRRESTEESMFDEKQAAELTSVLLKRALKEAGSVPIFEKFPSQASYLFVQWNKEAPKKFKTYIDNIVGQSPEKIVDIIRCFAPTLISTSTPEPFKSDFTEENFNLLTSVLDVPYINGLINKVFTEEEQNQDVTWTDNNGGLTDAILVRQFRYWSKKTSKRL